jgi:hypothetical protein
VRPQERTRERSSSPWKDRPAVPLRPSRLVTWQLLGWSPQFSPAGPPTGMYRSHPRARHAKTLPPGLRPSWRVGGVDVGDPSSCRMSRMPAPFAAVAFLSRGPIRISLRAKRHASQLRPLVWGEVLCARERPRSWGRSVRLSRETLLPGCAWETSRSTPNELQGAGAGREDNTTSKARRCQRRGKRSAIQLGSWRSESGAGSERGTQKNEQKTAPPPREAHIHDRRPVAAITQGAPQSRPGGGDISPRLAPGRLCPRAARWARITASLMLNENRLMIQRRVPFTGSQ